MLKKYTELCYGIVETYTKRTKNVPFPYIDFLQGIRNYLEAQFPNWTSENDDIDNLIQNCQIETISPDVIVEWIPYNNLENIKYLTKGGCSEIYIADWIDGRYIKWDNQEKQVKRNGMQEVILKKLENVESANRNWLDEVHN